MSAKIWLPLGLVPGLVIGAAAVLLLQADKSTLSDQPYYQNATDDSSRPARRMEADVGTDSWSNESERFHVRLEGNRLTVRAKDASLKELMKVVSRQAHIAVEFGKGVGAHRVSAEFHDEPLYAGLSRLLAGLDYFTYHRGNKGLLTVWIYEKLEGRSLYPIPFETWASTDDLQRRLNDPDVEERIAALEALLERGGARAEQSVAEALDDGDERVRSAALFGALNESIALPPERLLDLALGDESHNVRFLALKNLAGQPGEEQAAVAAADDPNPVVRSHAESVLLQLYPLGDPPEPGQQTPNSNP